MKNTRMMISLILTLSVFLSGCAMTENSPTASPVVEPTRTPISVETEPVDVVNPTLIMTPVETEPVTPTQEEPTQAPTLEGEEPPALYMLNGDIALPADKGSFCWSLTDEDGICADVEAFPLFYTEDKYTLVFGNTVELLFDAPFPDTIAASLYPDPKDSQAARVPDDLVEVDMDENGRILVTVPDDVDGYYALMIFATWVQGSLPYGDADYSAPVRFKQS